MLEADLTEVSEPASGSRAGGWEAFVAFAALGVVLGIAFFPAYFDHVRNFDDEGSYLVTIRQFLHHGHLYGHTHGSYGPFYYSFMGLIYRLSAQTPTLFNGRVLALLFTTLSSGFFAAAVWRVTRSVLFGALCQIATYSLLITVVGAQPLHPGTLVVSLLAITAFTMAGYAMNPRPALLVVLGALLGALVMTKANVGLFALVAIAVTFVIGNPTYTKGRRAFVAIAAVLVPFLVMYHLLWQLPKAQFAVLVSFTVLAALAPWRGDTISVPLRALYPAGLAAIGVAFVSSLWPLLTGTGPASLVAGVLLRPEVQTSVHQNENVPVNIQWVAVILTACAAYAALVHRNGSKPVILGITWLPDALLAAAGLWVLGQAVGGGFAAWLPAVALLPALAWLSAMPAEVRLALRLLVPLAILQMLHAYPVPGAQVVWGTVTVCVPCVIAVAVALGRQSRWQRARPGARVLAVGALALVLVVGAGTWPLTTWHDYNAETSLDLPGARLVKVTPVVARTYQQLTRDVKNECDTFYSAPGFDSLYIFTGLPTPTGLLANWPGVLTAHEQRELGSELAALAASGKRVCVVRDLTRIKQWVASTYGSGPLGVALAPYNRVVARAGPYTVSIQPRSTGA